MREIITIQVGQCGNQVGTAFWDTICSEHAVDANGQFVGTNDAQLDHIDVFFNEASTGRFVPRCVLIDLDPNTRDTLAHDRLAQIFRPDLAVWGEASAANNWAKGHGAGAQALLEPIMESIRRSTEIADSIQGLQMWHSVGGGTGSGLGALIAQSVKDEYPSDILNNVVVFPSALMSDTVVEPYNATLAFQSLAQFSDSTFVIDNEALYGIATGSLRVPTPAYADINRIVATAMSGVTASIRFPGILNSGLRKISVNLCPFPRLHYFTIGSAPQLGPGQHQFRRETVAEVTKQMFSSSGILCGGGGRGRYLAASALYRGSNISTSDLDRAVQALRAQNPNLFVDWMPGCVQTAICPVAQAGYRLSSTLIGNGSSICPLFDRIAEQFTTMLSRKAFLHWYTGEGVDEMQFTEAENDLREVTQEYRQYDQAANDQQDEPDQD